MSDKIIKKKCEMTSSRNPLLPTNPKAKETQVYILPSVKVETYDDNEETTCVDSAILLQENILKQWLVAPILSIVTLFVWPIFLYWKIPMQRDWLYTWIREGGTVEQATHVYIEGRDGNQQIVKIKNQTARC